MDLPWPRGLVIKIEIALTLAQIAQKYNKKHKTHNNIIGVVKMF